MTQQQRWRQVSEIFEAALGRAPEERVAYLKEQCGADESLRREVELLIESHKKADKENFFAAPAVERAAPLLAKTDTEAEKRSDRMAAGQHVGHYLTIRKLGSGGMGEVYLAKDSRLNRTVALKILPEDVASDQRRMLRFEQEARIVSSLNQPNILTIYEFGQTGSLHFIATEYVDGETLRDYLSLKQPKLSEILDISKQIVAALDAAHEANIIHRDVKPENVMIRRRDHIVKVLDFGLAKLTEKKTATQTNATDTEAVTEFKTAPGSVLGTVKYMSPEQAQGLAVDQRTDLWSAGVVLYEMLVGHTPFSGPTSSHTVVEILEREPPALARSATFQVPPELQRIVSKALAKNPDERYQTAKDMLIDLRNLKKRLELDVEIERSAAPDSGTLPVTTGMNVTTSIDSKAEPNESDDPHRTKVVAGLALVLVLVIGLLIAAAWSRRWRSSVAGPSPSIVAPERKLSYWVTVQKYRNGRPFEDPFRLAGEINFEKDYRVRLNVSSPQAGYLYIVNEGPSSADGRGPRPGSPAGVLDASSLVVLFPSPTANGGLSYLAENQPVEIPQQTWFQFDAEQGTEKLWLIFSANAVRELEAAKQFANPKHRGLISDSGLTAKVQEFLRAHSGDKATLEKDDELKQTSLRIPGAVLVHAIKLEHH